jgi:hypothetical protein
VCWCSGWRAFEGVSAALVLASTFAGSAAVPLAGLTRATAVAIGVYLHTHPITRL